jgi:hypothetical protein
VATVKILFFDDERWRHDLFDVRNREHDVFHAYTVRQFKAQIRDHVFDLISFDYDVDDDRRECGLDAVNALLALPPPYWPVRVVVHSWNSRGAGEMIARLREFGIEPTRAPFESETAARLGEAERQFAERNDSK